MDMSIHPRQRAQSQDRCIVHVFPDSATFGQRFARAARLPYKTVEIHPFPDGETLVRVHPPVGHHAVLIRSLHDPNVKFLEVMFAADALRRAGARTVTLIAPYLPYMRQDTVFTPGEPISQYVIGDALHRAFDRVLTIEAHLHRTARLSDVISPRATSQSAAPAIAGWIRRTDAQTLIVGPDAESEPWVRSIARAARDSWVVGEKTRFDDHRVVIRFSALPTCRRAVIVDDIASSGGTISAATRALRRAGVSTVDVVVVHAIFAPRAQSRIKRAGVRRLVSCDTIPHPTNAISVASLLADRKEFRT
jgi:ribose-phosphate pyrophosphokinase